MASIVQRGLSSLFAGKALAAMVLTVAATLCPAQSGRPLKAGYGNSPPMVYQDAEGKAAGFAVEVLAEAARRAGIPLQWVQVVQVGADEALRTGQIDVLPTGIPTPERRNRFYISEPWWDLELVAVSLRSGPISSEKDLHGKRIATAGAGVRTAEAYSPSEVIRATSAAEAASRVCEGRADAAILAAMYERELLAATPNACQGVPLKVIDLSGTVKLTLIARREAEKAALQLREEMDGIIRDGTIVRLASKHSPASVPNAERAAQLAQADFDGRIWRLIQSIFAVVFLALLAFYIRLRRSSRNLREANDLLVKSGQVREEALQKLRRSEDRVRRLVEAGHDWIWEIDAEGRYTFAGPQVKHLLGYEPEEILGKTPFDLMKPGEAERVRALLEEHIAKQRAITNLENVNLHKDGSEVVLETSGVPKFGAGGEYLGYSGADRDITARRREEFLRSIRAEVNGILASGNGGEETLRQLLGALAAAGGFSTGFSWHMDPVSGSWYGGAFWQAAGFDGSELASVARQARPEVSACLALQACESGRPLLFSTTDHVCEKCVVGPASAAGMEWGLAIPLRAANRNTGLLVLLGQEKPPADTALIETLQAIGAQTGEHLERERAEEEVRRFVSSSPSVLYALRVLPSGFRSSFVSANVLRVTGYTQEEALSDSWWHNGIHPADRERVLAENEKLLESGHQALEYRFRHKQGHYIWLADEKRLYSDEKGVPQEVVGAWSDITRRVELERQLLQAQKMEAIGALAAGVAHDFNNLLTVMNGYTELIQHSVDPGEAAHGQLEQVLRAGESAAGLTRRLLAFSRRQELQPRLVSLGALVADTRKLLKRMIGEDIEMVVLAEGTAKILADPGQLEQVLMNLAVNARDAMPDGGTLTISTEDVRLDEAAGEVPAGVYAVLTVRDTGTGIDEEIQARIFDPFFTTKEVGKGTGLGLSTVYGIVSQSGGFLTLESRPEQGAVFRAWFPVSGERTGSGPGKATRQDGRGSETVLLVEDEELVREVATDALRSRGYHVIPAGSAAQALAAAEEVHGRIDLLLTDVVMPGTSGIELVERFSALYPGIKILFMTGYADPRLRGQGLPQDAPRLQKPFTPGALTQKVRQVLEGKVE